MKCNIVSRLEIGKSENYHCNQMALYCITVSEFLCTCSMMWLQNPRAQTSRDTPILHFHLKGGLKIGRTAGTDSTFWVRWLARLHYAGPFASAIRLDIGISLTDLVNFVFTIWLRSPCIGENDVISTWIITKTVNPTTFSTSDSANASKDSTFRDGNENSSHAASQMICCPSGMDTGLVGYSDTLETQEKCQLKRTVTHTDGS